MPSLARARRVGDRIQEELADILMREVSDPRLDSITITGVDVDRELAFATIYVHAVDGDERAEEVLAGLESARGFLRSQLATRIQLRTFPQLRFRWDLTQTRAARIEDLLDQIRTEKDDVEDGGSRED
ncbi:MAG: 30S ribosome-binding factor RbfA [Anaerolineales bacterium]|jgi:ribosome-binding factor A